MREGQVFIKIKTLQKRVIIYLVLNTVCCSSCYGYKMRHFRVLLNTLVMFNIKVKVKVKLPCVFN